MTGTSGRPALLTRATVTQGQGAGQPGLPNGSQYLRFCPVWEVWPLETGVVAGRRTGRYWAGATNLPIGEQRAVPLIQAMPAV